jgi:outer membrane protein TolC
MLNLLWGVQMKKTKSWLKTINICLLLILITLSWVTVFATSDQPITLDQAIQMALKHDYKVGTASNDLEKSKLAVKQQVLQIFPQAKIDGSYLYGLDNQTYPNNYSLIISESIPTTGNLYGHKVVSNVDAAVWDQMNSEAGLQITKATVIFNTTQDYMNALKAQRVLQMQEEAVKNAQAANDLSSEQLRIGKVTKTTQLQAENNLANANLTLEQNKADLEIALQQLGNQIGIDDISQITLVDDTKNFVTEDPDFDQLKAKALKDRLELQQAKITIKKAELAWAQAANQELPAINLSYNRVNDTNNSGNNNINDNQSYSVSYDFLSGNLGWNASSKQSQNNTSNYSSTNDFYQKYISLEFTWNLDFGIARNLAAQAKVTLDSAKISQQQTVQTINLDLDQAIHDYKIAVKKTQTNQKLIPYYQKDLEIKKLQNQLGTTSTPLDVSTAELNLLQAQITVISASYDQLVAYQKLKLVSGELYPFKSVDN